LDRLVVTGTLKEVAHREEMSAILYREGFQCFGIWQFAEPLRQRIGNNALEQARQAVVGRKNLSQKKLAKKAIFLLVIN
jgi:phage major head subunit gpT-like protein